PRQSQPPLAAAAPRSPRGGADGPPARGQWASSQAQLFLLPRSPAASVPQDPRDRLRVHAATLWVLRETSAAIAERREQAPVPRQPARALFECGFPLASRNPGEIGR